MKTKIILIGRSMAGKTTLCQYLTNEELRYKKTQTIQVINKTMVDTPGEYFEHRFWGALSVTAAEVDCIVLVQQSTESGTMFPPGYATTFGKPCVGEAKSRSKMQKNIWSLQEQRRHLLPAAIQEKGLTHF